MFHMLIPSIISIVLIRLVLLMLHLRRAPHFSEKSSWEIVDSTYERWPNRPVSLPKEKNDSDLYLNLVTVIEDTVVTNNQGVYSFSKIAGVLSNSLPLHTTEHSDQEHYLTTILLSFHKYEKQIFLDILSLDKDFSLSNSLFSLLFISGTQWDFAFTQNDQEKFTQSIPLTCEQLQYMTVNSLDKWRIRREEDGCFTVGALNFETRKYIYKLEIQATIQTMAKKIQDC